jgi:hypothetical protein
MIFTKLTTIKIFSTLRKNETELMEWNREDLAENRLK